MNLRTSETAVAWRQVAKSYVLDWRGTRVAALCDLTLEVRAGAICALVGPNGSGKSTTLKLAAGLLRADRGECCVAGLAPTEAVQAGLVAYLPEETAMPEFDTTTSWLERLAEIGGLSAAAAKTAAQHALAEVRLEALADRPCGALSKGQRQRLGLAQAILREAAVLLLDEPMTGLDPRAQNELIAALQRLRAGGRTIVLSAHFLPQLAVLCDQFAVLDRGRVIFTGDQAAVADLGGLEALYLERVP